MYPANKPLYGCMNTLTTTKLASVRDDEEEEEEEEEDHSRERKDPLTAPIAPCHKFSPLNKSNQRLTSFL
jgi:hypothetical protein